jgi:formylglycine-generating enzyme required for sulfatase activity/serine/threonine protein kinase
MAGANLAELSHHAQEMLEAWLVEFDQSWQEDALASWVANKLPGPGSPLRAPAVTEMVKIDMERQWQRGSRLELAAYLQQYPELGTTDSVAPDLILAEYQIRRQFGVPAEVSHFARRYPRQAADVARLIEEEARASGTARESHATGSQPAVLSERDTSRTTPAETAGRRAGIFQDLPDTFGRYRILKRLGQGGMGAVYLADDTQLERSVALKVPNFSADDRREVVERFLREARAAAKVRHPHLCPVYDVGETDGIHYMTMAYIEGQTLAVQIQSEQFRSEREAAALVHKLALALQESHAHGIVHRDLKPTNIMIDQRGEPVIMDFGLARRAGGQDAALTQSGALLGTPAYMAPEQARGDTAAVGPLSDIYSLGVILYELLTGRRPFEGNQVLQVLNQIQTMQPAPPASLRPNLDSRLEAICLKAMAKRPEDRYATMAEMAAALDEYLKAASRNTAPPRSTALRDSMALQSRGESARALPCRGPRSMALPSRDESAPALPSRGEPSATSPAEESYGLTEAAADLSQLLGDQSSTTSLTGRNADRSCVIPIVEEAGGATAQPVAATTAAPAGGSRSGRRIALWVLLAACGAAIVVLGIVVLVSTRYGLVKIELNDPKANVQVKVDGDVIELAGLDRPLRLRTGEHAIEVTGEDYRTVSQTFTVTRGSETPVQITLERKPRGLAGAPAEPPMGDRKKPAPPAPPVAPSADAPPPAIAPFDEKKAKEHQQAWAKYLGVPVEITNSIGMKLVLIPPGEFMMGTPDSNSRLAGRIVWEEMPAHTVKLTKPFYLGTYEVTVGQFRRFVDQSAYTDGASEWRLAFDSWGDNCPVALVSWYDAEEFCEWLTTKEGQAYRLPTEAEWEYACRAGKQTGFAVGDTKESDDHAWFTREARGGTHPTRRGKPNGWGLWDMQGSRLEWCADWYGIRYYDCSPREDPPGPEAGSERVVRSGGWHPNGADDFRPAHRGQFHPRCRGVMVGFRLVRQLPSSFEKVVSPKPSASATTAQVKTPVEMSRLQKTPEKPSAPEPAAGVSAKTPPLAMAPFDEKKAKQHQQAWAKYLGVPVEIANSIDMKLILIPSGEFSMGAPDSDPDADDDEKPRHRVRMTKSFYFGIHEVTQSQYRRFIEEARYRGENSPWPREFRAENDGLPVVDVNWREATKFCEWLSGKERQEYRLPTEAEWEYACRAGTQTRFSFGDEEKDLDGYAWFDSNSGGRGPWTQPLHPVGTKKPNAWGLYDMHGNVDEFCQDWHDPKVYYHRRSPVEDPPASASGTERATRGGAVVTGASHCRASHRYCWGPDSRVHFVGFRVALSLPPSGSPSAGKR